MNRPTIHTPASEDTQGRDAFVKFCRALHDTLPRSELARHVVSGTLRKRTRREFSETEIAEMLARLRVTRGQLRKADRRADLRAAVREVAEGLREAGLKLTDNGVTKVSKATPRAANGIPNNLALFKRLPRGQLTKGIGLPPESSNAANDSNRASDGATLAHEGVAADRAAAGVRQPASPFGPPSTASMSNPQTPPTDSDSEPRAGENFGAWLKRQRPRKLRPGNWDDDSCQSVDGDMGSGR